MAEVEKNIVVENNNSQPGNAPAETIVLDHEALLEAVRNQLDYYFSKENLRTDTFLMSQMDAQMSVPVSVVMKFAKLRALTQDEEVVKKALEHSTVATLVDNNRIKSSIKSGRSTIILREIPSETPEDEVRAIFDFPGSKPVVSLKSEIGDTWFVTMESEEDAKDTLLGLKMQKRTFQGAPIKARLKSETIARSYYVQAPLGPAPVIPPSGFPMPYYPPVPPTGFFPPRGDVSKAPTSPTSPASPDRPRSNSFDKNQSSRKSGGSGRDSSKSGSRDNKGRGGSKKSDATREAKPKQAPVLINNANFPPLHASEEVAPAVLPASEQGVGYSGEYKKYSIDDIINIVKNIKDATPLPENIKPNEHPAALSATPNLDLLQRQRTFSIDETREQLRQGRPVQREAVAAGSVDYGVMMYGDDYQGSAAAPVVGGSWAGVLKKGGLTPPAAAAPAKSAPTPAKKSEKPATSEKQQEGKKQEGGASSSKKEKKERKAEQKRARSDSNASNSKGNNKKDEAAAAPQPSGWGGRPTFANVLKLKEEEAAKTEAKSVPAPAAAPAPKKGDGDRKQDGKKQNHDNHDKKGGARPKNNFGNNNRAPTAENADGMWVKGKTLPPKEGK